MKRAFEAYLHTSIAAISLRITLYLHGSYIRCNRRTESFHLVMKPGEQVTASSTTSMSKCVRFFENEFILVPAVLCTNFVHPLFSCRHTCSNMTVSTEHGE